VLNVHAKLSSVKKFCQVFLKQQKQWINKQEQW